MRRLTNALLVAVSFVACGLTDRHQDLGSNGDRDEPALVAGSGGASGAKATGQGGTSVNGGGSAPLGGAGLTAGTAEVGGASVGDGGAPIAGLSGSAGSAGSLGGGGGGEALGGGAGGVAEGGAQGEGGRGAVTVSADGLVFITYVPATPETVVTVEIDPQCVEYGSTIVLDDAVCALTTVQGDLAGKPRVCIAKPEQADHYVELCRRAAACLEKERILTRDGVQRCCAGYFGEVDVHGRVCANVSVLGAITYSQPIDSDGDGGYDAWDNCPYTKNILQLDEDYDGVGNSCDNCPGTPNPDQTDSDQDGVGDACEGAAGAGGAGG